MDFFSSLSFTGLSPTPTTAEMTSWVGTLPSWSWLSQYPSRHIHTSARPATHLWLRSLAHWWEQQGHLFGNRDNPLYFFFNFFFFPHYQVTASGWGKTNSSKALSAVINKVDELISRQYPVSLSTDPTPNIELENPSFFEFYVVRIRRSTDFKTLKLQKGRSRDFSPIKALWTALFNLL